MAPKTLQLANYNKTIYSNTNIIIQYRINTANLANYDKQKPNLPI